jgi:hypothetical protein
LLNFGREACGWSSNGTAECMIRGAAISLGAGKLPEGAGDEDRDQCEGYGPAQH